MSTDDFIGGWEDTFADHFEGQPGHATGQPRMQPGGHLEKGYAGEQTVGFFYDSRNGWKVVDGPSGHGGHPVNAGGFDLVAYNPRTDELHIVDNKALKRPGNISRVSAMTINIQQNLDSTIRLVDSFSESDFPEKVAIRARLVTLKENLMHGRPLSANTRLIVTNVYGESVGVTMRLRDFGIEFRDKYDYVVDENSLLRVEARQRAINKTRRAQQRVPSSQASPTPPPEPLPSDNAGPQRRPRTRPTSSTRSLAPNRGTQLKGISISVVGGIASSAFLGWYREHLIENTKLLPKPNQDSVKKWLAGNVETVTHPEIFNVALKEAGEVFEFEQSERIEHIYYLADAIGWEREGRNRPKELLAILRIMKKETLAYAATAVNVHNNVFAILAQDGDSFREIIANLKALSEFFSNSLVMTSLFYLSQNGLTIEEITSMGPKLRGMANRYQDLLAEIGNVKAQARSDIDNYNLRTRLLVQEFANIIKPANISDYLLAEIEVAE